MPLPINSNKYNLFCLLIFFILILIKICECHFDCDFQLASAESCSQWTWNVYAPNGTNFGSTVNIGDDDNVISDETVNIDKDDERVKHFKRGLNNQIDGVQGQLTVERYLIAFVDQSVESLNLMSPYITHGTDSEGCRIKFELYHTFLVTPKASGGSVLRSSDGKGIITIEVGIDNSAGEYSEAALLEVDKPERWTTVEADIGKILEPFTVSIDMIVDDMSKSNNDSNNELLASCLIAIDNITFTSSCFTDIEKKEAVPKVEVETIDESAISDANTFDFEMSSTCKDDATEILCDGFDDCIDDFASSPHNRQSSDESSALCEHSYAHSSICSANTMLFNMSQFKGKCFGKWLNPVQRLDYVADYLNHTDVSNFLNDQNMKTVTLISPLLPSPPDHHSNRQSVSYKSCKIRIIWKSKFLHSALPFKVYIQIQDDFINFLHSKTVSVNEHFKNKMIDDTNNYFYLNRWVTVLPVWLKSQFKIVLILSIDDQFNIYSLTLSPHCFAFSTKVKSRGEIKNNSFLMESGIRTGLIGTVNHPGGFPHMEKYLEKIMDEMGIVKWVVPKTGLYSLFLSGASGGISPSNPIPSEADEIRTVLTLKQNETFYILLGQQGTSFCEVDQLGLYDGQCSSIGNSRSNIRNENQPPSSHQKYALHRINFMDDNVNRANYPTTMFDNAFSSALYQSSKDVEQGQPQFNALNPVYGVMVNTTNDYEMFHGNPRRRTSNPVYGIVLNKTTDYDLIRKREESYLARLQKYVKFKEDEYNKGTGSDFDETDLESNDVGVPMGGGGGGASVIFQIVNGSMRVVLIAAGGGGRSTLLKFNAYNRANARGFALHSESELGYETNPIVVQLKKWIGSVQSPFCVGSNISHQYGGFGGGKCGCFGGGAGGGFKGGFSGSEVYEDGSGGYSYFNSETISNNEVALDNSDNPSLRKKSGSGYFRFVNNDEVECPDTCNLSGRCVVTDVSSVSGSASNNQQKQTLGCLCSDGSIIVEWSESDTGGILAPLCNPMKENLSVLVTIGVCFVTIFTFFSLAFCLLKKIRCGRLRREEKKRLDKRPISAYIRHDALTKEDKDDTFFGLDGMDWFTKNFQHSSFNVDASAGPIVSVNVHQGETGEVVRLCESNPHYGHHNNQQHQMMVCLLNQISKINRSNLTLSECIGKGAFGQVYKGYLRNSNAHQKDLQVAVKTLPDIMSSKQDEIDFAMEAFIMSRFDHENIVKLLGVSFENQPRFIILELLSGGDLRSYLREKRTELKQKVFELLNYILDVAHGCWYLEQNRFVHRDIAARNCLVDDLIGRVKIGDFGMSRDIYRAQYYKMESQVLLPVKWMPPEAILDGIFTCKTDVWSFGVLMWEVLSLGYIPYADLSNRDVMEFVINKSGRLDQPRICPDSVYCLMSECWQGCPEMRPSFEDIIKHIEVCRQSDEIP